MNNPCLLLIDIQQGLDEPGWGERNNPGAESNMALLLEHWRGRAAPLVHIQHCSVEPHSPLRADSPGNAFKTFAQPLAGEVLFQKNVNSAFIGTGLEAWLHERNIRQLVIIGLTTDHCVSTTTRMAGNLGFEVTLVADATATFSRKGVNGEMISAEQMHSVHLASLNGEFCSVLSTQEVLGQSL